MNKTVNKLVLAGDKFMPEMHLKQSGFTYSACEPFIKNKERIQKFKETGDTKYIYRNELDKACFQHDMAYGDFKYLARRTVSDTNKIWVDKGSKFYNSFFKKWLKDNDIKMYSIHNEGKPVVAKRFNRILKTKIYKYMTSVSKNVHIDKLDDIVNEYNNTYHRTIKKKPVDVKDKTYIDFSKEVNNKDSKFKVGDHVRISKPKNIFTKGYTPNWSEEFFVIKEVKNTVPWTYVINDLKGEEIVGTAKRTAKNKSTNI